MGKEKGMRTRMLVLCFVMCVCVVIVATALAAEAEKDEPKAPIPKWQHLALTHQLDGGAPKGALGRQITKLGKEGWELVSVANVSKAGTTTKTVFYLKRWL